MMPCRASVAGEANVQSNRLLAKSWRRDDEWTESLTLPGHLKDALAAVEGVLSATARDQLRSVGIECPTMQNRLGGIVRIAAAVHDLGKLNSQFQAFIQRPWEPVGQTLRHEWVTLLLLDGLGAKLPAWGEWLRNSLSDEDWRIVRWVISGHHPKYGRGAPPTPGDGPSSMILELNHPDVQAIVDWLEPTFDLEKKPRPRGSTVTLDLGFGGPVFDALAKEFYKDHEWWEENIHRQELRTLIALAKNTLIAADVAASALSRGVTSANEGAAWIKGVLDQARLSSQHLKRVSQHHIDAKHVDRSDPDVPIRTAFQDRVAAIKTPVGLITAGCGSGKTLAAYRWAEHHARGRRLFVCYPTTGTALEGFKDYLMDPKLAEFAKTIRSDLITSRRELDLRIEGICDDRNEAVARIESLDLWHRPLVACTWDAVLGVIQNNRRGMFGWPAIAQGTFIFDECHSADDRLFDSLLTFIETMLGSSILLMTASLPDHRRAAIERAVATRGHALETPGGPTDLETRPRYRLEHSDDWVGRIRSERTEGRALVVLNTVERAMRLYDQFGETALLYHSRFKYGDRLARHKATLDRIKPGGNGLAVSTQVCEMSFNGDATLLVTEVAPIPALIQRLGRLNRFAKKGQKVRPFIVIEPGDGTTEKNSPLPYDADDLERARAWLKSLERRDLSQADLIAAWKPLQRDQEQPRGESAWLDHGPLNTVLELREGSPGITVIMEDDLDLLRTGQTELSEVVLSLAPPPRKSGNGPFEWQLTNADGRPIKWHNIDVASRGAIAYLPVRGATWNAAPPAREETANTTRRRRTGRTARA